MNLSTGTKLGPYEIIAPLGAGGMGEVFRARDTKLGRDVALKILPATVSEDPDRIARFKREAQVLASLNHPHIAAIYAVDEAPNRESRLPNPDAIQFLVMELVDGETLAARLKRGPIPIEEAIAIARQIADALQEAHEKGIIHRDLKPANIALTAKDQVKVLDFGLAKLAASPAVALASSVSMSPTLTTPAMTAAGMILGTAAYMAPEQAKGREADKRCDVWAFGCVLYEMLTAKRAFEGEDVTDTLATILKGEPNWSALPADVSSGIRTLLKRCVEKDPRQRVADFSAVQYVLTDSSATANARADAGASVVPVAPRRTSLLTVIAVATASLAVGAAVAWMTKAVPDAPRPVTRFAIALPHGAALPTNGRHLVALSPDGRNLAFAANNRLWLRALDRTEAVAITGGDGQPSSPFFSSDGAWVGFYSSGQLRKVAVGGGASIPICLLPNSPAGASWQGDVIFFDGGINASRNIYKVSAGGGTPEVVITHDDKHYGWLTFPSLLPGGAALLLVDAAANADNGQIVVQILKTGERRIVANGGTDPHYVSSGHIVYAHGNVLYALPFDVSTLKTRGDPVAVVEGIGMSNAVAHLAVSVSGSLVSVTGLGIGRTLAWVDREGREQPIASPSRAYAYPRLSPDGGRVAVAARDEEQDIWITDLSRATFTRLTFGPGLDIYPHWTLDGRRILYSSNLNEPFQSIFAMSADGTGSPERLTTAAEGNQYINAISPDGRMAVIYQQSPKTGNDLLTLSLDGSKAVRPLVQTPFNESAAALSADGRWLAYQSNESGRNEVFVRPFPDVDRGRWQVSTDGGGWPVWGHDGRELFYVSADIHMMSVSTMFSPAFAAAKPAQLFDMRTYDLGQTGRNYDVTADGKRFVVVKTGAGSEMQLQVVENWSEELKAKAPALRR